MLMQVLYKAGAAMGVFIAAALAGDEVCRDKAKVSSGSGCGGPGKV